MHPIKATFAAGLGRRRPGLAAEDRVRFDDHAVVRVEVDFLRSLRTRPRRGRVVESVGIGTVAGCSRRPDWRPSTASAWTTK